MRKDGLLSHPAVPYAGPFVVFMALLAVMPHVALPPRAGLALWVALPAAAIWLLSREVLDLRPSRPVWSVAVGAAVFAVWVGPDVLWPEWRESILFRNALMGEAKTSLPVEALSDPWSIALRTMRAVLVVPVLEELFWRGWLMRWVAEPDFRKLKLGHYDARAFWVVAVLFALEHGTYWDVGLAAGIIYNWWMVRTGKLGDLILAHAVTNGCLCWYVVAGGHWQYWL
jgi:hypothetical protein